MADEMNVVKDFAEKGIDAMVDHKDDLEEVILEPAKKAGNKILKNAVLCLGSFAAGVGLTELWHEHKKYEGMTKEEKKAFKKAEKERKNAERDQRVADFRAKFNKVEEPEIEDFDDEEDVVEE